MCAPVRNAKFFEPANAFGRSNKLRDFSNLPCGKQCYWQEFAHELAGESPSCY